MKRFYYFIGEPGAGKTTLVEALTSGHQPHPQDTPVPHIVYGDGGIAQIGRTRGEFAGTDALAMNIQPKVVEWLQQQPYSVLFAEGDRLANDKFFQAVIDAGYELRIIMCEPAAAIAADRRRARAFALRRSEQNPQWLKGRQSKVINLARIWKGLTLRVNTNLPVGMVVEEVRRANYDPFGRAP